MELKTVQRALKESFVIPVPLDADQNNDYLENE